MATEVQDYVLAADRENTVRSYASALRSFETAWKGMLPATVDTVARYSAEHASIYRISTLRLHLAALARWHADNGFADPTRSPLVHKVLRGIRSKHGTAQRRARPLQLDVLETVSDCLLEAQALASKHGRRTEQLRRSRDRSLLLLGFWRAFRADELANMRIEEVVAVRGVGLTCRPGRTKNTDEDEDRAFHCPALSRLCPVDAYLDWLAVSGLTSGPVYPGIDRWGNVSQQPMKSQAVLPLLRRILKDAGTADADTYSSHSLRRGFAGWARANGWELKELMELVGWRDVNSALRYIEIPQDSMKSKFERGLANGATAPTQMPELSAPSTAPMLVQAPARTQYFATIQLRLLLTRPGGTRRGTERAQRQIESVHLVKFGARQIDRDGRRFELQAPFHDRDNLDETLIETHLPMMFRIGVSIKVGRITPSTILRRLGTPSRKNKLYFAFQELGKVLRTIFLLKYISDVDLRRFINAETNKSEQFNNFLKLIFFGSGGLIAENIRHEQQKVMKFAHLVANMLIVYNVRDMERVIRELRDEGFPITPELLADLNPYRLGHVNMFGDYAVDRRRRLMISSSSRSCGNGERVQALRQVRHRAWR